MPEKIVGILGGMGPDATVDLFQKILRCTPAERDQDHLRILIDCNSKIPIVLQDGDLPIPVVDATLALARLAVREAQG